MAIVLEFSSITLTSIIFSLFVMILLVGCASRVQDYNEEQQTTPESEADQNIDEVASEIGRASCRERV